MMGYGRGYYGTMMGGGWFAGFVMLLFGALLVAGVVLLILWAVRASAGHNAIGNAGQPPASGASPQPGAAGHDEAVAIAKKRLATGEITSQQYAEIMRALGE